MKKQLILVSIVALLVLSGCGATSDALPAIRNVEASAVNFTPSPMIVRGTVESAQSRNVYTTLGFLVDHVDVEIGDHVLAGQTLAVLDTADLELMIEQQRLELEMARIMAEIIPLQRRVEVESMRNTLAPQQQNSELNIMRQSTENAIRQSRRMYEEAVANLENNTNMHIVQAKAALTASELNLTMAQRNYEIARSEYESGNNFHVVLAESALNNVQLHLETIQTDHERLEILYAAGALPRNDLRQSENALVHAQNALRDTVTNLEMAQESERRIRDAERRALEQAEIGLYAATAARRDALTILETTRIAVQQELDMLRGNLEATEIAGNVEPIEIAIDMTNTQIASGLETMEHAINLELAQLRATIEALEIALRLMERQLENSTITAPINGTITAVIATEGSIGMGLMFIVENTENLRVITSFREYEIAKIDLGMEVIIRADATGHIEHKGIIRRISPAANIHSPIVEFEVEVEIISQNTGLRIGMDTRVEVKSE